ncbi:hypothetical protein JZ751_022937 [Albula glossodonta]|uniref:Uncharacterized protein n=1 Tax=Albula glossodonta TaxID=121402 RepID=A0A8T2PIV8_9TELE|nr:hypothetical protein JZ751_022937 [Albula glossodonta]
MEDRSLLHNIRQAPKPSTPVLGTIYLNDCPAQRYIPIYLLVSGVFAVFLAVLSCLPCTKESEDGEQNALSSICTAWNSLVSLFLFCWFIAGNVWIYSIYAPSYDQTDPKHCNKTLYLFAFWTTTLVYIMLGVLMAVGCLVLVCMCLCGTSSLGSRYNDDV